MTIKYTPEKLLELGQAVASHLGPEWEASYKLRFGWNHVAELTRGDGATLRLSCSGDRVRVSGEYPVAYSSYREGVKDITVAVARGPLVIAREIRSRLLASYVADYTMAVAQIQRDEAHATARQNAIDGLATILKESVNKGQIHFSVPWLDDTREQARQETKGYGTVRLYDISSGELKMDLVPIPLLAKLLQVVQDYRVGETAQEEE